jgi:uncharacterized membrane protein
MLAMMTVDDAPASTAKSGEERDEAGPGSVSGHTETINRPRGDLYAFWRDFSNLPRIMENVVSVTKIDDRRSHWIIAGPTGNLEWDAEIVADEPGRLIEWRSVDGADIAHSGRIDFRDAPPGRGSWVTATIAYQPPAGFIGKAAAKITQKEPAIQARRDLRRFKQYCETGEIATTTPPNPEPKA